MKYTIENKQSRQLLEEILSTVANEGLAAVPRGIDEVLAAVRGTMAFPWCWFADDADCTSDDPASLLDDNDVWECYEIVEITIGAQVGKVFAVRVEVPGPNDTKVLLFATKEEAKAAAKAAEEAAGCK